MSITVRSREQAPTVVETTVELPLYRKHELDDSTIYMRIEDTGKMLWHDRQHLREVSIQITHPHTADNGAPVAEAAEIEITDPYWFDERSEADYSLGRGEHACTAEEFAAAAQTMRDLLDKHALR